MDPETATVANGIVSAGGSEVSFGDIVRQGDISRTFTEEELAALPLKPASERTLLGKPMQAKDIPAKATGEAVYGIDVELPGMVYAHPLIPPTRYGSTIRSIDDTAAKDIRGYQQTLVLEDPSEVLQGWAVVVADDLLNSGRRHYVDSRHRDPFARMAEMIVLGPPDSTTGSLFEKRVPYLIDRVASSRAKGVIFYYVKFCEPEAFYLPALKKGLEKADIPSIVLEVEIGEPLSNQIVTRLQAFIEILS